MGEAEHFTSADTTGYINRRNNYIELALVPLEAEEKVVAIEQIEPVQEIEEELAQVQEEPEKRKMIGMKLSSSRSQSLRFLQKSLLWNRKKF